MKRLRLMRWMLALGLSCVGGSAAAAQWKPAPSWSAPAGVVLPDIGPTADAAASLRLPPGRLDADARITPGGRVAVGAVAGAVAGALAFYISGYPCSNDAMFCELGFVSYAAVGALVGGFVGWVTSDARHRRRAPARHAEPGQDRLVRGRSGPPT